MLNSVIVVDDEASIRTAVEQWLSLSGFSVQLFARGEDCLAQLPRNFPGVILSDVRMPAEGFEKTSTVLGSGAMYPEVEAAIAGMQPGEEKTIDVTLPADWHIPQFAGKTVTSTFKLVDVAEQVLPEVDAAFIRSFGVKSGDLDQFKTEIRSNLERELKGALMNRLRREVGEQLIAAYADVELPPRLVENEARALLANATEQARRQGQQVGAAIEAFQDAGRKRVLVALLIGFCLLAAVMTMLLRQMNPGMAALLCVAFGTMTLLMLLPAVGEYATQIRDFLSELSLEAVYGQTMLKAMGIVLMTQFAAQVCRDMDAPSIACRAELCGRLMHK